MADWFGSAAQLFGKRPAPEPEPFEIRCSCGRAVAGRRLGTWQQLVCPGCERVLFVLPGSVYPKPRSFKSRPVKKRPATRSTATAEPRQSRPAGRPNGSALAVAETPARRKPSLRRLVSPLRCVLLGVVLVSGWTVWWGWHVRAVQSAERLYAEAFARGESALAEGDLAAAAASFEQAESALSVLGRNDLPARRARQFARETRAALGLLSRPLLELMVEAEQVSVTQSQSRWFEEFQFQHRGAWILLDASVRRIKSGNEPEYSIEFPLITVAARGRIQGNLKAFSVLPDDEPHRVIFAAQIDRLRQSTDGHSWDIVLSPDSGFLWSSAKTWQAMGLTESLDAETESTLTVQQAWLALVETPSQPAPGHLP